MVALLQSSGACGSPSASLASGLRFPYDPRLWQSFLSQGSTRPASAPLSSRLLEAVGDDPSREGLVDTPRRIAEMYSEIFEGLAEDPASYLKVGFEVAHDEMVILRNIPFYSMCEHHLLPFHGEAHMGYLPEGRVVGISKLARVVEAYARRPQIQERLTSQVAETVMEALQADGVAVVVEAEHLCMTMRGGAQAGQPHGHQRHARPVQSAPA